jgi:threonine dehydratase
VLKRALNARVDEILPEPTPLERAQILSERLGFDVWIKREDLTPVFSFKLRGAYNRIANLTPAERAAELEGKYRRQILALDPDIET